MILEHGNNIYFLFLHIFEEFILKNLVELPSIKVSGLNYSVQLEIIEILYIIKLVIIVYY